MSIQKMMKNNSFLQFLPQNNDDFTDKFVFLSFCMIDHNFIMNQENEKFKIFQILVRPFTQITGGGGGRGDYFAEASYRALIQKASLTNKDTLQRQTQK